MMHLRVCSSNNWLMHCLSLQLKDLETSQDPRKLLASGRSSAALITKEEKSALQRDIKEQEVLLQGYQKVIITRGSQFVSHLIPAHT